MKLYYLNVEHMKAWLRENGKSPADVRREFFDEDSSMIYYYLNGNTKKVQEKTARKLQSVFGDEVIAGAWKPCRRRLPPVRTEYFINVKYLRAWLVQRKKSPLFIEQWYKISFATLYRYLRGEVKTVRPSKVARLEKVFGKGIVKVKLCKRKGVRYGRN